LELEKNGYYVQILEKEKHPGGKVHSDIIASSSTHDSMYSGRLTAKQAMTN
jgi:phytoene dehydrogenase-like protein